MTEPLDPQVMRRRVLSRMPQRLGSWYAMSNQAGDDGPAVVRIYDDIGMSWFGGITEDEFARELDEITADEIEVQISSSGGDVFAGVAIFNALRAHPARVTTRVDGLAASIASVIVQAGEQRTMLSGSQQMIHPAWGLAIGPASEMREFADLLDRQTRNIAGIYAERSGRPVDEFVGLLDGPDRWMNAQEAVDEGLADEVVNPGAASPEDSGRPPVAGQQPVINLWTGATLRVADDGSIEVVPAADPSSQSVAGVGSRLPAGGADNRGDPPTSVTPVEPANEHPDADRILRHHDLGRRVRARAAGKSEEGTT